MSCATQSPVVPVVNVKGPSAVVSVPPQVFANAVLLAVGCVDEHSTRYALGNVLFEFSGEKVTVVATDTRQLYSQVVPLAGGAKVANDLHVLLPAKFCRELVDSIGKTTYSVTIAIYDSRVDIDIASRAGKRQRSLTCEISAGRFPKWRDVVPATSPLDRVATLNAVQFAKCLTGLYAPADDENRGAEWHLMTSADGKQPGSLAMTRKMSDGVSVQSVQQAENVRIPKYQPYIDPSIIGDYARNVASINPDATIDVFVTGDLEYSPLILRRPNVDGTYLVMGLSRGR